MTHAGSRGPSLILGICLILGLALFGWLIGNAALGVKALDRTVVVKGLSEREVAANVVSWPVTFQVATNDLEEAFAQAETHSATVKAFLIGQGIPESDISLSPPEVTDLYARQWGDKSDIRFRYTGNASVTVFSEEVDAVRRALSNVVDLGKQGVAVTGRPQFSFTELSALKPVMVEEATKNARSVAEKFAQDSNSELGKIKSAWQGQFSISDRDATTPHIKKVRVVSTITYYLSD